MPDSITINIEALKVQFFELMDERLQLQCSANGCTSDVIAKQITEQNALTSKASLIAIQIDDMLGENWEWLDDEAWWAEKRQKIAAQRTRAGLYQHIAAKHPNAA